MDLSVLDLRHRLSLQRVECPVLCSESVASVGVGPGLRMRCAMCAVNGARPGGEGGE